MGAASSEGSGPGSAEGRLRGYDLDKIHKVLLGQVNILKSCCDLVDDGKYRLRVNAGDITISDENLDYIATTVQAALDKTNTLGVIDPTRWTYRPGGVTEGNFFGTWEELYALFQETPGVIRIILDGSIQNPITFPDGTWDMEYRAIFNGGIIRNLSDFDNPITTSDGVLFKNLNRLEQIVLWTHTGTSHVIEFDGSEIVFLMDLICYIFNFSTGGFFSVGEDQTLSIVTRNYSTLLFTSPLIHLTTGTSSAFIYMQGSGLCSPDPFSGSGAFAGVEVDTSIQVAPLDLTTDFPSWSGGDLHAKVTGTEIVEFTNSDLSANVLTVSHSLGSKFVSLLLTDPSDQLFDLSSVTVTFVDNSSFTIDFGGSITAGTWRLMARK